MDKARRKQTQKAKSLVTNGNKFSRKRGEPKQAPPADYPGQDILERAIAESEDPNISEREKRFGLTIAKMYVFLQEKAKDAFERGDDRGMFNALDALLQVFGAIPFRENWLVVAIETIRHDPTRNKILDRIPKAWRKTRRKGAVTIDIKEDFEEYFRVIVEKFEHPERSYEDICGDPQPFYRLCRKMRNLSSEERSLIINWLYLFDD